jgi:hypothetical protein
MGKGMTKDTDYPIRIESGIFPIDLYVYQFNDDPKMHMSTDFSCVIKKNTIQ